jgi:hypothetical protein
MQIAIGAHVGVWLAWVARAGRGVPTAVVLELRVAPSAGPCVIAPDRRVGLGVGARGVVELVGPDQCAGCNRRRGGPGGHAARGKAWSGADGLDGQFRSDEHRRLIDRGRRGGGGPVDRVSHLCPAGRSRHGEDHSAVLRGGGRESRCRYGNSACARAIPGTAASDSHPM